MAGSQALTDAELNDFVEKLNAYAKLTKKDNLTNTATGKMVKDNKLWCDLKPVMESSIFSVCKDKGKPFMTINKQTATVFITKCAAQLQTLKKKASPQGSSWESDLVANLKNPQLSGVTAQSKTGNVDGFTDTSKYTGSHANRFDKDGKGVGGADEKVDNTGYVGNYKNAGTYDAKMKK